MHAYIVDTEVLRAVEVIVALFSRSAAIRYGIHVTLVVHAFAFLALANRRTEMINVVAAPGDVIVVAVSSRAIIKCADVAIVAIDIRMTTVVHVSEIAQVIQAIFFGAIVPIIRTVQVIAAASLSPRLRARVIGQALSVSAIFGVFWAFLCSVTASGYGHRHAHSIFVCCGVANILYARILRRRARWVQVVAAAQYVLVLAHVGIHVARVRGTSVSIIRTDARRVYTSVLFACRDIVTRHVRAVVHRVTAPRSGFRVHADVVDLVAGIVSTIIRIGAVTGRFVAHAHGVAHAHSAVQTILFAWFARQRIVDAGIQIFVAIVSRTHSGIRAYARDLYAVAVDVAGTLCAPQVI